MKPGVLFVNFGGPTSDDELVPFLTNLLADVLPLPELLRRPVAGRLARLRAERVRPAYRQIGWSPLVADSRAQVDAVREALGPDAPPMAMGMMFTAPTMADGLRELLRQGVDKLLVVGLYPHWSFATSGSAYDMVHDALEALGRVDLPVHYARSFFDDDAYVQAVAHTIRTAVDALPGDGPVDLLFTAHGLPLSFLRKGDPYPDHVRESVRRVVRHLGWTDPWHVAWQSRLGPVKWLAPGTPEVLAELGAAGSQRVVMVPVSFVGEHIETLFEIDVEYAELAHEVGIPHVGRAAAVGLEPSFVRSLAGLVQDALARFGSYACSRCLVPKPESHRRRKSCPNCAFETPRHLRLGQGGAG